MPRAERREQSLEIGRQRRVPTACETGKRMHERKARRVQRLPRERDGAFAAVRRVADQRVAERSEVNANLMRAPGLEPAAEQRSDAEPLDDVEVRARRFP